MFQTSQPFRISKLTIFIGLFIIISASFLRQIMDFIKVAVGEGGFILLIGAAGTIFLVSFLILIIRKRPSFLKFSIFIIALITGMWFCWQLKIPEEKIHLLEFAVLGWFASRDLIKTNRKVKGIIFALAFTLMVGVLDEVFQGILPYRYFQWFDIGLNSAGGLWGVILYLLS